MTLIDKIIKDGKLPEIETKIAFSAQSLIDLAITLIIVAIVIMLAYKLIKWL